MAPAKGGPMAINFLILFKKFLLDFSFNKFVKVNKLPYECDTTTTGFPVFEYNLLIWSLNTCVAKLFVAKYLLKSFGNPPKEKPSWYPLLIKLLAILPNDLAAPIFTSLSMVLSPVWIIFCTPSTPHLPFCSVSGEPP